MIIAKANFSGVAILNAFAKEVLFLGKFVSLSVFFSVFMVTPKVLNRALSKYLCIKLWEISMLHFEH